MNTDGSSDLSTYLDVDSSFQDMGCYLCTSVGGDFDSCGCAGTSAATSIDMSAFSMNELAMYCLSVGDLIALQCAQPGPDCYSACSAKQDQCIESNCAAFQGQPDYFFKCYDACVPDNQVCLAACSGVNTHDNSGTSFVQPAKDVPPNGAGGAGVDGATAGGFSQSDGQLQSGADGGGTSDGAVPETNSGAGEGSGGALPGGPVPGGEQPGGDCAYYDAASCLRAAEGLGLRAGGDFGFEGDYPTRGCFYYPPDAGSFAGQAYFGTGGGRDEMATAPLPASAAPAERLDCSVRVAESAARAGPRTHRFVVAALAAAVLAF